MNKYIDAEKLKKSIGNYVEGARAALNPIDGDADYYKGKIDACKDIQEFITSLQQEQPEVDLKKEISRFILKHFKNPDYDKDFIAEVDWENSIKDCARHFYELGLKARKEE